jgi:hypothetical protein
MEAIAVPPGGGRAVLDTTVRNRQAAGTLAAMSEVSEKLPR